MTWTKHYDANGNLMGFVNMDKVECVSVRKIYKPANKYAVEAWTDGQSGGGYWLAVCETEAEATERMEAIMGAMLNSWRPQ